MIESPPCSPPVISIRSSRVALALALAIATLTAASLAGQILRHRFNHDHVFGLVPLFNLNVEANLPTWYASATLLIASTLLWLLGRICRGNGKADATYWFGLALLFLGMSLDEAAMLHERLNPVLRPSEFLPGFLYFGWVIAGAAAVVVVGLLYANFVFRLAPPVRRLFVVAALLFVGGALGVEMLGARHAFLVGTDNLEYALIATVEEAMEMTGVAVFIVALLRQLALEGVVLLRAS